jgi:hypothetical protein
MTAAVLGDQTLGSQYNRAEHNADEPFRSDAIQEKAGADRHSV